MFSKSFLVDEHLEKLRRVLTVFRDRKILLEIKKFKPLQREQEILGFIWQSGQINIAKEKRSELILFQRPVTLVQLQSFLGEISRDQ